MSQEQPPFGLPGPILAEIQRRPRSRIKFNCPPSVAPDKTPKIDFIGKIQRISGQNLVDRPGLFQIGQVYSAEQWRLVLLPW